MRRKQLSILCLLCLAGLALSVPISRLVYSRSVSRSTSSAPQPQDTSAAQARIFSAYGKLPLSFEENQGQTDGRVKFLVRGNGYTVFLTKNQTTTLRLTAPAQAPALPHDRAWRSSTGVAPPKGPDAVVRLALVGSNPHAEVEGVDLQPGRSNYFIGNNPARWHHNVPHYARVKYRGVYPGVDLVYYGNQGQLESDYVLAPGANPGQIELRVDGARSLKLDSQGDLVLATASGDVLLRKPRAYQEIAGGRQEIPTSYIQRGPHLVGIRVSGYDSRQPLIVDPVMIYSTYLGGTKTDKASAIAVDSAGNAYVTGSTTSTDFPTTSGVLQQTFLGNTASFAQEVFVTKLNLTGSALVYSTFLGGTASGPSENGAGIAVDASGNAFITGTTAASDFPVTPGTAFQSTLPNTSGTAFLTELNPTGSALVYSSYFGGSGFDAGQGIALDASGIAYVTGNTTSINFPITPASAFQTTNKSATAGNAFISKIDITKTGIGSLVYSTYLGGGIGDSGTAIAVDSSAKVYVTGFTSSTDFPIPSGVNTFQTALKGSTNAFVVRLDTTVSASLLYSTYLGGSGTGTQNGSPDEGHGIAVDPNFNVYVVGTTGSTDFPVTSGAFQTTNKSGFPVTAFVARLDTTKTGTASEVYGTYLGGTGFEQGLALALDSLQNAYVTGLTASSNFPVTVGAPQTVINGTENAYVSVLNPTGSALVFSTFWGGDATDIGSGITLDSASPPNIYLTGTTTSHSPPFVTSGSAFQKTLKGAKNAFVAKFSPASSAGSVSLAPGSLSFGSQTVNTTSTAQTVTLTNGTNSALTINSTSITGANAADFAVSANTCPASTSTLAAGANCTISVTFKPATTAAESATLTVTSSDSGSPHNVALSGTGTAAGTPDFTISLSPTSGVVTAGGSVTFIATVTSQSGFASAVSLTCSGAPVASTCLLSPASVTPAANATVTSSGTITTTKRGMAPPFAPFQPYSPLWLWSLLSLALALSAVFIMARRTAKKLAWGWGFAVITILVLAGCSGPPNRGSTGTPAGPATITVKGTSGTLSHSATFSLTVN